MNKIFRNIKENYKLILLMLLAGIFLGWIIFHPSGDAIVGTNHEIGNDGHDHEAEDQTIWTCSMHPQIKQDSPGLCPICAMDLIPLASMNSAEEGMDPNEIMMSDAAAKLADIQTLTVSKGKPEKTIYLMGKVQADERNIAEITSRFGGRIEQLFINFTGQQVREGEKLASIYSPELVSAQKELLEAVAFKESRPSLYNAAKSKLSLWDLTEEQISAIENEGKPRVYFDVLSPISGTIVTRHVSSGDYVKEGNTLFKVIDLSRVWVMFDAYERDLQWISPGDSVNFTLQALPGKNFSARVNYIDPFINPTNRVAQVRVEVPNKEGQLKPEMFANGILESKIAGEKEELLIPKTSVLWTGKRAVVYVMVKDRESPTFLYREIVLGPEAGAYYVVADGLQEGEEIAVNGVFKIDAASQLQGLPSMMNPGGGSGSTPHDMSKMDMSSAQTGNENNEGPEHTMVKVYGNCGMCKARIEEAAGALTGVLNADWDEDTKMLHLQYQPKTVSVDDVEKTVAAVGHDTDRFFAPDDVYAALPGCCLYDRPEQK